MSFDWSCLRCESIRAVGISGGSDVWWEKQSTRPESAGLIVQICSFPPVYNKRGISGIMILIPWYFPGLRLWGEFVAWMALDGRTKKLFPPASSDVFRCSSSQPQKKEKSNWCLLRMKPLISCSRCLGWVSQKRSRVKWGCSALHFPASFFFFFFVFALDKSFAHLCLALLGSFCPWKEFLNIFSPFFSTWLMMGPCSLWIVSQGWVQPAARWGAVLFTECSSLYGGQAPPPLWGALWSWWSRVMPASLGRWKVYWSAEEK